MEKIHIKSAVQSHSSISLDSTHLTTLDFGQISPIYTLDVLPGDSINIDASVFSRMAPLYVPTFGKADLKTAAFYVPYHQVAEDADAFFAGKKTWQGQIPALRCMLGGDIFGMFLDSRVSDQVDPDDAYDWAYVNADGSTSNMRFTDYGRYVYKVMRSLGYQIPDCIDLRSNSQWNTGNVIKLQKFNALPLLCFFKVYNDYMAQSQRYNTSILSNILLHIRQNKDYVYVDSTYPECIYDATTNIAEGKNQGRLHYGLILEMFDAVRLCYDGDMFTKAWESPQGPLANGAFDSEQTLTFPYSYVDGGVVTGTVNANQSLTSTSTRGTAGMTDVITARALKFLNAFDSWVRRNNYSGSRDVQQIFSRFGIKSDEYRTHYAHMLGEDVTPLQIGDVTATASSGSEQLGDYAGKGIISGSKSFSCKADDFGQIIILAWIAVRPVYADGFDYNVLRTNALDFYNPEFDGIGPRAISIGEVYQSAREAGRYFDNLDNIYGFTERYNEYRYPKDRITGDFALFHGVGDDNGSGNMAAWHFGRDLDLPRYWQTLKAQSTDMTVQDPSYSEYDRIFNIPSTSDWDADKFYLTCRFNVSANRPIKNQSEVTQLGEGNLQVQKNGDQLS